MSAAVGQREPNDAAREEGKEPPLEVREIGRRAASGAALLAARSVFQQVLGLVSTIVVTRLLLPDQLGIFTIASTISGVLWIVGGGQGMAGALIRRTTAPDKADLRVYIGLQLAIMTVLAAIAALATLPFGTVGQVTAIMVAFAPVVAFRGAALVTIERQLQYGKLATAETSETLVYYVWTVVTVALGWGVWGLATATVMRFLVGTAIILALAPAGVVLPGFERTRARALLGMGLRVQAVEVVGAVRDQILVSITAVLGGLSVVGYYNVILRVLQAPTLLIVALLRVSFPAMSQVQASGEDPKRMLPRMLTASAIFFGFLLAPLAGAAPAFVPLLLGARWSPAADVLPLVCLGLMVLTPLNIGCLGYLWAIGDAKSPLRAISFNAILVCAIALPFVRQLGVLAIAVGLAVAAFAEAAVLARAVARRADVRAIRAIRVPVVFWVIASGAAWICAETAGPLLVRAVVSTIVALLLYLALLVPTHRELIREMARLAPPLPRLGFPRRGGNPAPAPTR